jgi:Icc protein
LESVKAGCEESRIFQCGAAHRKSAVDRVHFSVSRSRVQWALDSNGVANQRPKRLKDLTKSTIELVQLTDQHLFGDPARSLRGVPTLPALRATLAAAQGHLAACDAILATGDLVQDDPGGYVHFRAEMGRLGRPVLCIPGNHDDVPAMYAALAQPPFQCGGTWDAGNWRVILLDSTVAGETGGRIADSELAFLEQALVAAAGRHALVCLHHHPVPLQSRWLDGVALANGKELLALLRRFPAVRGVVFGHVHQAHDGISEGLRLIATPSTCSQFKPRSDEFALDHRPPAWRRLSLHADGRLDTSLHWLAEDWAA